MWPPRVLRKLNIRQRDTSADERPLRKGQSDAGGCAKTTCADTCIKDGKEGAERYPSVHKTACGGLFRIAAGDTGPTLVSNLIMILLSSHSHKQWGQLGEILGGVRFP